MNNYHYLFKFIIVGDSNVGKSCLLLQYTEGQFRSTHDATIGVEYGSKELVHKDKLIKLQIWDTAGQESFRSITRAYYRGSIGCILVYDVTKRTTFTRIEEWFTEYKADSSDATEILVVGNKIDLPNREISYEEGQKWANKMNCHFAETSAKTGENVELIFDMLAHKVCHKIRHGLVNVSDPIHGIKVGQLGEDQKPVKQVLLNQGEMERHYCC